MGSSSPKAQPVTQTTSLPPWLEGVTKENLAIADQISRRPYQAYTGQLQAGFTPEQEAAFHYAQAGIGATQPVFGQAINTASQAAQYDPMAVNASQIGYQGVTAPSFLQGNVGAYMNPYIENVENAALSRLQGATQQAVNRIGDQAVQARAFGGSRQGIAEGVALGEAARSAGELSANLRSQGYNQAAALLQADQQRAMQAQLANQQAGLTASQVNAGQALQAQLANQTAGLQGSQQRLAAANQLANLGTNYQQSRQLDAALLENIGQQRQAMNQAALDEAYARYQEERNYPIEMLNLRLGATSATPYGTTTSGTQFVPRGNNLLAGLGAAGSAASGFAALAPLLGISDERMKTDVEKVGKDEETGLTMYAYRYKGDPKTYPKVVGPMAQEIEKKYPGQVTEVAGRKAVNLGFGPMRKALNNG